MKEFCHNLSIPEKQIPLRTQDYCCKFIGPPLEKINLENLEQSLQSDKLLGIKEKTESIAPLIIWTDKDHYNFRDKDHLWKI